MAVTYLKITLSSPKDKLGTGAVSTSRAILGLATRPITMVKDNHHLPVISLPVDLIVPVFSSEI